MTTDTYQAQIDAYVRQNHSETWAYARLRTIASNKSLNHALVETHATCQPDFASVQRCLRNEIFSESKAAIVRAVGYDSDTANDYRDKVGLIALRTIDAVQTLAADMLMSEDRPLSDNEQVDIICQAARLLTPAYLRSARLMNVSFLSGEPLSVAA